MKPLIYDLSIEELGKLLKDWKQPAFRSKQIWEGLYKHLWNDPDQFTNLPLVLREKLKEHFTWEPLSPDVIIESEDLETVKTLFQLERGGGIEVVLMRYEIRRTLCISTQVGCAMDCSFCATGQMGYLRNLSRGEIVEQVLYYERQLRKTDEKVTNIVVMGMGEPFHNYEETMAAVHRLNDPDGLNLGARRFTISTVGLIPGIRKFINDGIQANLAISLHAADDDLRSTMIPINRRYPLGELIQVCRDYVEHSGRRITFEWALIQGVNDSYEQAEKLAGLLKGLLCHVNLIPLNPTSKFSGSRSTDEQALMFQKTLDSRGIPCTVRLRRGVEIQAGCGQLADKHLN
ncbi:MAG: 23S rRNA (adenine(2503)-C(2))-methyltransferase RlmN [Anaerolineales bacterium]|nr:23S rRNA (adenine(2503)-C(2))-methyltransferase RlmN [Anaerolineales bacterium]